MLPYAMPTKCLSVSTFPICHPDLSWVGRRGRCPAAAAARACINCLLFEVAWDIALSGVVEKSKNSLFVGVSFRFPSVTPPRPRTNGCAFRSFAALRAGRRPTLLRSRRALPELHAQMKSFTLGLVVEDKRLRTRSGLGFFPSRFPRLVARQSAHGDAYRTISCIFFSLG